MWQLPINYRISKVVYPKHNKQGVYFDLKKYAQKSIFTVFHFYVKMWISYVRSNLLRMHLWPVEHFFPHFLTQQIYNK